jgi:predicted alpha/beta hydrolase family esterase
VRLRWPHPRRVVWVAELERSPAPCQEPPLLVAHSLGCIAVAHWAAQSRRAAAGALLVAPCDVESRDLPAPLQSFAPAPEQPLRFPAQLAASTDDPYLRIDRASALARAWRARLRVLGALGHINAASGFGPWPDGEVLLEELRRARA